MSVSSSSSSVQPLSVRIIGLGRAGGSFYRAFESVEAVRLVEPLTRHDDPGAAATGVDVVLITTPDSAVAPVAQSIADGPAVVLHAAGSLGLDVLAPHQRVGSIHPLMALPNAATGAERLRSHGWFAVAGDPVAQRLVEVLGGRHFEVADEDRSRYHATAAIAANHLTALLGQVERLADSVGVPMAAFLAMAQGAFDSVVTDGAAAALTGPAARGDEATLDRHRNALPASELATYEALVKEAQRLAATSTSEEQQ